MKYFRKIIKHWPTIWLIIAIICFGSVISYSAYTRLSGIKRVVSTQKGSTALFSSNHLYPDRSDLEYIVCTNETNDVVIRFTVCNYAQNNQTKHYNGKLAYELKAQLTDKNGTPLSSNNIPASGIYTIQKTASEASEVCDLLPSGISKTFKGELYDSQSLTVNTNKDVYELIIDKSQIANQTVYVKVTATTDVSELPDLMAIFAIMKRTTTQEDGWKGEFIHDDSASPSELDGYNYVISGYGEKTLPLKWDPDYLQINPMYTKNVTPVDIEVNVNGVNKTYKQIDFPVNSSEQVRYQIQFYRNKDILSTTTWTEFENYVKID